MKLGFLRHFRQKALAAQSPRQHDTYHCATVPIMSILCSKDKEYHDILTGNTN